MELIKSKILKLLSVFIFYILFLQTQSWSEQGWRLLQTGTTQSLHSLVILDTLTVFAVGDNGTFLKTTNGGMNFNQQFLGTNNQLYIICFPTPLVGYIFANAGNSYLKTTNAGVNWDLYFSPPFSYPSVFFTDPNIGYATTIGFPGSGISYILKTTNGGINWMTSYSGPGNLSSITFIGQNTGFASGVNNSYNQGIVLSTTNSGNNWNILSNTLSGTFSSLYFNNTTTGYIAGSAILKTTNAGANWLVQYGGIAGRDFYSIFFPDINTGYAVGTYGVIIKTTNGGNSWTNQQNLVTSYHLNSVKFINSATGYAVGNNGTIIKTTTGGEPIGIIPKGKEIPESFSLYQNFPNPFNPTTTIEFDIPKRSQITIKVYDILGNVVDVLARGKFMGAGSYQIMWDASNFSSGVYFYTLEAADYRASKKMVLVK